MSTVTEDGFLDGKLRIAQPRRGFRAGLDAVMLAAAVPAGPGQTALELGAGVGTASLCLAHRVACAVTGVEIDPQLVALASRNAAANGLGERAAFVQGDALALVGEELFDHVFCNPPFHDDSGRASPDAGRARALNDGGQLRDWVRSGLQRVMDKGTFTLILRADRLDEALAELPGTGVSLLPLLPHAGEPPKRVLLQVRPGAGHPLRRLEGLVLHRAGGGYGDEAEAVLRGRADLTRHFIL